MKAELAGRRQLTMPLLLEEGKLPDPSCMARMLLRPRDGEWSWFCGPVRRCFQIVLHMLCKRRTDGSGPELHVEQTL